MTRIHNIGHIHNANFVPTQFSTSHPQKHHFLKSWEFTFLWKYCVCGFKFEISEYTIKLLYLTYSPHKYELERIKSHEMRAKNFPPFFYSVHGTIDLSKTLLNHSKNIQVWDKHVQGLLNAVWDFQIICDILKFTKSDFRKGFTRSHLTILVIVQVACNVFLHDFLVNCIWIYLHRKVDQSM